MGAPVVQHASAHALLAACEERGLSLATAESLTGGMLVARLVDVPGASRVVQGGACTYSFEAKASLLGLDLTDLREGGAVRGEVARAMARGARRVYGADLTIATTGVAGPGSDEYGNPEGLAFVAVSGPAREIVREVRLRGTRAEIRAGVVDFAIALAIEALTSENVEASRL
ncbi:CinA family protein [Dermabacter vaginalis]|uniref:CinA family protein n=1 Tax=Dermabacter vaginalis TaxID=1630135 RepID=UPI0021A81280|nr:CinA family protein [Dermabacter vaginalis]MCT2150883.1 CinA family protein [Dermabacter vaginalis]